MKCGSELSSVKNGQFISEMEVLQLFWMLKQYQQSFAIIIQIECTKAVPSFFCCRFKLIITVLTSPVEQGSYHFFAHRGLVETGGIE